MEGLQFQHRQATIEGETCTGDARIPHTLTETVDEYAADLTRLFDLCQCQEPQRRNIFMQGLQPDIRMFVHPQSPKNLDVAIRLANEG